MENKKRIKIECYVEKVLLPGPSGREIEGVEVTCSKCHESRTSFGTGSRSITRCLAMLNNSCPLGEDNIYAEESND